MRTRGNLVNLATRFISVALSGALLLFLAALCPVHGFCETTDPPALTSTLPIVFAVPPAPPLSPVPAESDVQLPWEPPTASNTPFFDSGVKSVIELGSIDVAVEASQAKVFASQYADLIAGDEPFTPGLSPPFSPGRIDKAPPFPGINWSRTLGESLFFLGMMHTYRLIIEPDTRHALTGKFWHDYINSVSQLRGWSDGDSFITNYVGHPMMGATAGRILVQNDPRGRALDFAFSKDYLKSRLKAFGYATLFSTQFEWGLISEGTIGNATPNQYTKHPFSYIDFVVTPTVGTAWLVGEDIIDKYVIRYMEQWTTNRPFRCIVRSILNPTRAVSNAFRFKTLWYRDNRPL